MVAQYESRPVFISIFWAYSWTKRPLTIDTSPVCLCPVCLDLPLTHEQHTLFAFLTSCRLVINHSQWRQLGERANECCSCGSGSPLTTHTFICSCQAVSLLLTILYNAAWLRNVNESVSSGRGGEWVIQRKSRIRATVTVDSRPVRCFRGKQL